MVRKIPVCWRHLAFWETSSSVSYIVEFMQHGDWLVCLVFGTLRSQGMRLHCQPVHELDRFCSLARNRPLFLQNTFFVKPETCLLFLVFLFCKGDPVYGCHFGSSWGGV